jgi:hypothetical protein
MVTKRKNAGGPERSRRRYSVPDGHSERDVADVARRALAGGADVANERGDRRTVLWDDGGDQTLVHLDSVVVKLLPRFVIVSVDFETDQTGVAPLIGTLHRICPPRSRDHA